jgi:hypothetical protein
MLLNGPSIICCATNATKQPRAFFPRRRNESRKTGIPKKKSGGERYEGGIQRKKKVKLQKKKKKS